MQKRSSFIAYFFLSMIGLMFLSQCKRVDYAVRTKWVYINDTDSSIHYSPDEGMFNLEPKGTAVYEDNSDGPKEVSSADLSPPLRPYIVYYGTSFCDTIGGLSQGHNKGEGPLGIANYEVQKIKNNDFVCTFRFTDSMVKKAGLCGP